MNLSQTIRAVRFRTMIASFGSAGFLFAARALAVIYQLRFAKETFGPSYGGLIALLNQVTFYFLLAELGLAAATTSLLFEPIHRGERARTKALITSLQRNVRIIVLVLAPVGMAASMVLAVSLRKQLPLGVIAPSLALTCAAAMLTLLALPYQSYFNAADRVPTRNMIIATGFAVKVAVGICMARTMHSFTGLPLGTVIVGLPEFALQRWMVRRELVGITASTEAIEEAARSIRSRAKFVLFHRIGYLLLYQSDYIILLLSSSLATLGLYAEYQYIYAGMLSFSLAVAGTLTAKTAQRQLKVGREGFSGLYRTTASLALGAAGVCGLGFYLSIGPSLRLLYHNSNADPLLGLLFAILLMLNVLKINDDMWIDTTGTYRAGYYLPIMEACTYVVLGIFLAKHLHTVGVLYAGIATNILFSVILKSFVIGGSVMERQVTSTLRVKGAALIGIAALVCACLLLGHAFRAIHIM